MLGNIEIGTMQGRLLPKYKGRYQAHPKGYWQEEFSIAAESGLELIEFILDYEDAEENPLLDDPNSILDVSARTGVRVRSICADYFMTAPPHRSQTSADVLNRLILSAGAMAVEVVVVPCVDESSLIGASDVGQFVDVMKSMAETAAQKGVSLALETDLAPKAFADLLEKIGSRAVSVNYDTGNSASLGFDVNEEFAAYGELITDIHLKDRTLGGGPVVLGTGACDFKTVMEWIRQNDFQGPLIMQAYRDEDGVDILQQQLSWLQHQYSLIGTSAA